jgi:hypothetical protein
VPVPRSQIAEPSGQIGAVPETSTQPRLERHG